MNNRATALSRIKTRYLLLLALLSLFPFAACEEADNSTDDFNTDGDISDIELDDAMENESEEDSSSESESDRESMMEAEGESETDEENENEQDNQLVWEALSGQGEPLKKMLGVSSHMKQNEGESWSRDFEFEKYVELGGASIREDYHWHKIEPSDDDWHFEAVQTQVDLAEANGTPILAMLAYGVDWAMPDGKTSSIDPAEYGEFAGAVAAEFCDKIKDYEIWNEPNISRFWKPEPDPFHYGLLLKEAYTQIKAACPDANVLTAGFSALDEIDPVNWWAYLDLIHEGHSDICDYFDTLAIHPYTFNQQYSPERDYWVTDSIFLPGQTWMTEIAREKLEAMGCPERPIWFTEMGWTDYDITEEIQGNFLARSMLLAARDGIERYFWYTFWNGDPSSEGWRPHEDYFGLFGWRGAENPRRAKPAWHAMKGLADVLGAYRFAEDVSSYFDLPNDVYVLAFVKDTKEIALALWDGRDNPDGNITDGEDENWETTYEVTFSLPENATRIELFNISGLMLEAIDNTGEIEIELTSSVQYLRFMLL